MRGQDVYKRQTIRRFRLDILTKFEAVTVKAEIRLAETDRLFCEAHEKAYRTALACFQEMEYIWEDICGCLLYTSRCV